MNFEVIILVFVTFIGYWYQEDEEDDIYVLCGNGSGSRKCPQGYVCWKDRGKK